MLEVPVFNVVDCITLELIGVKRIYLESGIGDVILTPSFGLAKLCSENTDIPIYANIKASTEFTYGLYEIDTMREDVKALDPFVEGFLIGILDDKNMPDIEAIKEVLSETNKNFIFSRAFDKCEDPLKALEMLKGFDRCIGVITSGGNGTSIIDNKNKLKQIIDNKGRLSVTVASGLNLELLSIISSNLKGYEYDVLIGKGLRINGESNEKLDKEKVREAKKIIELHS